MNVGKVEFKEGEYFGSVENGQANGFGYLKYNNGDIYVGEWKNNSETGKGGKNTREYASLGDFANGKRQGKLCCVEKNVISNGLDKKSRWDAYYIGDYANDLKNGRGVYAEGPAGNYTYLGNFVNDKLNGHGYFSSFPFISSGSFDEGNFVNGKMVGKIYSYPRTESRTLSGVVQTIFYGNSEETAEWGAFRYWGFGVRWRETQSAKEIRIGYHNMNGSENFSGVKIFQDFSDSMKMVAKDSQIDYYGNMSIGNRSNSRGNGISFEWRNGENNFIYKNGDTEIAIYPKFEQLVVSDYGTKSVATYRKDGKVTIDIGTSSSLKRNEVPVYNGVLNGGKSPVAADFSVNATANVAVAKADTTPSAASGGSKSSEKPVKKEKTIDDYFEEFKYDGPYSDLTIDDMPSVGWGKGNVGSAKPAAPSRATAQIKTSVPANDYTPSTPTEKIYDYGDEYGQTLSFAERVKLEIANRKGIRAAKKAEKEKAKKAAEKKKAKTLNSSAKKTSAKVKIAKPVKTPLAFEIDENGLVVVGEGAEPIGPKDFESVRKDVTTIRLASSVKKIEQDALYVRGNREYKKLTAVDLSATDDLLIEANAFSYQTALQTALFPHNIRRIGMRAFDYCPNLYVCDLSETTSDFDVDQWAFGHCAGLESVVLPHTTYVGSFAFAECRALTSFDAPCVKYLYDGVFYKDYSLRTVNAPNVMRIEKDAFCGCDELSEVIVHAKCKIKFGAFPKGLRKKKKKVGNTKVITFSKK